MKTRFPIMAALASAAICSSLALAAEPAAGPVPDADQRAEALLDELAVGHPALRQMLRRYPALKETFADPDTAEVLRHAPHLPGTKWRVHDMRRPQPRVAAPGRCDSWPPRAGAVALFDSCDLTNWSGENVGDWTVRDGILTAGGKNFNMIKSSIPLGDAFVHIEFRDPVPAQNAGQHRGNGGVYMMRR